MFAGRDIPLDVWSAGGTTKPLPRDPSGFTQRLEQKLSEGEENNST